MNLLFYSKIFLCVVLCRVESCFIFKCRAKFLLLCFAGLTFEVPPQISKKNQTREKNSLLNFRHLGVDDHVPLDRHVTSLEPMRAWRFEHVTVTTVPSGTLPLGVTLWAFCTVSSSQFLTETSNSCDIERR